MNSMSTLGQRQLPDSHRSSVALDVPKTFRVRFSLTPSFFASPLHAYSRSKSHSTVVLKPVSALKGSRERSRCAEGKISVEAKRVDRGTKILAGERLGSRIDMDDEEDLIQERLSKNPLRTVDEDIDRDRVTRDDFSDISDPASPGDDGGKDVECVYDDMIPHELGSDGQDDDSISAMLNSVGFRSRESVVSSTSTRVSDLYHFVGLDNRQETKSAKGKSSRDSGITAKSQMRSFERERVGEQEQEASAKSKASIRYVYPEELPR
jgi:hypothetical protein